MDVSIRGESYVLPKRWRPVPVIGQKQFLQPRVAVELYTEHLEAFSLIVLDTRPDRNERAYFGRVSGN
jgi:hypothetical protein